MSGVGHAYQANETKSDAYDGIFDTYKDIYPSLKQTFGKLAKLRT